MNREILDFLKMNDVKYKEKISLSNISPIRIGGVASLVAYPDSEKKLVELISLLKKNQIKYKIVGRMSNILFSDKGYDGLLIRTDHMNSFSIDGNILIASCGVGLPYISGVLCDRGFSGFEEISGIPGSITGAIIGNAGSFGREIGDILIDVRCYIDGNIRTIPKEKCDFAYRSSTFKSLDCIVLSARFLLENSDPMSIKSKMDIYRNKRKYNQPINMPSLGSTFKRPGNNIYASKLIDECGLKGYSIGGAQVSIKHAGFIVNTGSATAKNYVDLSDYVTRAVYDRFGIYLEREVEIL